MNLTLPTAIVGLAAGILLFIFCELIINNLVKDPGAKQTLIVVSLLVSILVVVAIAFSFIRL